MYCNSHLTTPERSAYNAPFVTNALFTGIGAAEPTLHRLAGQMVCELALLDDFLEALGHSRTSRLAPLTAKSPAWKDLNNIRCPCK
jgi:hypothetical protein